VKAFVLLLGLAGVAWAESDLKLPRVTRAIFDNGLHVVVAEYHELPLVEFNLIVGAGAAQDPRGKEGVAAVTANALRRGAGKRSAEELARAIESLGGRISTTPGTDGTIITAEFLRDDFAAGLDLLRQVMLDPKFARDEVRRARDEQEDSIVAGLEDASTVAEKCYGNFLYGSHPYGRPVEGRRSTVSGIGRSDVTAYYDRWYRPNNTTLVLVGDVSASDAVIRLREAFGAWRPRRDAIPLRPAPPEPVTERRLLLVDKADATQAQIRFGNVSIKRNDPDYLPAQVANTILGGGFTSKLIEELREKRSLTYAAWSMFAARFSGGDFRVGTFTKNPTTAETLALALTVEGDFRNHPPDRKALDKAKSYLRGQFPLRLQTPDALAARLAEIEFYGLPVDELETFRRRVAAVTPADVQRVARAHMPPPDQVAGVVVGQASQVRAPLEAKFGAIETITPDACDKLSAPRR